jgi:hypothetical protein
MPCISHLHSVCSDIHIGSSTSYNNRLSGLQRFQPQFQMVAQEAVAYHCFRGLLMPDTAVLLSTAQHPTEACMAPGAQRAADQHIVPEVARLALSDAESAGAAASLGPDNDGSSSGSTQSTAGGRLLLVNRQRRTSREPSASTVHVHTNDGEVMHNRQQTYAAPCNSRAMPMTCKPI